MLWRRREPPVVRHTDARARARARARSLSHTHTRTHTQSHTHTHTHTHTHIRIYISIRIYGYIDADGLEHLVAAARAEWWDIEKLVELRTDVYKAVKRY
jgi:hypothetical protein